MLQVTPLSREAQPGLPLPSPPRQAARRRWPWLAVALVALSLGAGHWLANRPAPPPAAAPRMPSGTVATPAPPGMVVALGKLIPRQRILAIAPPYGAGDARIATMPVQEGEHVPAGGVLARLDSEAALAAALASAEATLAAREAALEQTRIITATALRDAQGSLARAEAAIPILRRDFERAQALSVRGDASVQALDQRRLAFEQVVQDAARARATLGRYSTADPEAQVDVLLARRNLEAAAAERDRARADLDRAVIRAPMAGTVLTLHARPGERPGSQGLMSFGALDDMICEIEVYEDQLRHLAPGQRVTLLAVALPEALQGRLARIGVEVMRQTLTDASPAANTDTRVVRAVVELEPASAAIAARFANLQVTARIALAP